MNVAWALDPFSSKKNMLTHGLDFIGHNLLESDKLSCVYVASNAEVELATMTNVSDNEKFLLLPRKLIDQDLKNVKMNKLKVDVLHERDLSLKTTIKRICDFVKAEESDLLMIGSYKKDLLERELFGSFSETMIYALPCDLFIFSESDQKRDVIKNILFAHDFSKLSIKGLKKAVNYANKWKAKLTVLHVPVPKVGEEIHDFQRKLQGEITKLKEELSRAIIDFEVSVVYDVRAVSEVLMDVARKINADVISVVPQTSRANCILYGSITHSLLRETTLPTLVVKID